MKTKFSKSQLLMVAGFLCVLAALLLANKKSPPKAETGPKAENHQHNHLNFWLFADSINDGLDKNSQAFIAKNTPIANKGDIQTIDTLVKTYASQRQPLMASLFKEKLAETTNTSKDWTEAGTRFYICCQFYPNYKADLLDKAIHALEKALVLDSKNLDAKVRLGVCFVEGTSEPMKGISLLKEVLAADSNNIEAHLNLGLFAIQSGQYDKAIDRFNKILSINPQYIEAYIYLGQTFANKGDKKKAIEVLEKYKRLNKDELINEQVNKYINELKTS